MVGTSRKKKPIIPAVRPSIALHPVRDADILEWMGGLERGSFSSIVRGLIRKHIDQREIMTVEEKLDKLLGLMQQGIVPRVAAVDGELDIETVDNLEGLG